jgi:hypothetical protein
MGCLVPGCTNKLTSSDRSSDHRFICTEHWQATDRDLRRLLHRTRCKLRARPFAASSVLRGIEARTWQELARQAVERARKPET